MLMPSKVEIVERSPRQMSWVPFNQKAMSSLVLVQSKSLLEKERNKERKKNLLIKYQVSNKSSFIKDVTFVNGVSLNGSGRGADLTVLNP